MARTAITVGDGVSVEGRLMAQDASVTLINDNITLTPCVEDNRNAAAVAILVDRTAPTVGTAVTPAPDAGGWNRTPVQIGVSGDDGNGSGIAYLKATVDGSDPRGSRSTVQVLCDGLIRLHRPDCSQPGAAPGMPRIRRRVPVRPRSGAVGTRDP